MTVFDSICDAFPASAQICVLKEGKGEAHDAGSGRFNEIMAVWTETLKDCRPMPAFGVSLDEMTVKEMKSGTWLEFAFDGACASDDMSFERLAVKVEADYRGFNVIRYNSVGGYAGRCYYIDLVGDMSKLYDCLNG